MMAALALLAAAAAAPTAPGPGALHFQRRVRIGPACGADPELEPLDPSALPLLPPWPATWNMSLSTAIMPCNYSGLFDTAFSSRFGIADYVSPPLTPTLPDSLPPPLPTPTLPPPRR